MRYVGSKNRLSKELAPIIQSYIKDDTVAYIEPFVGGANMIDKIKHHTRIGSDLHFELIELLNKLKDNPECFPDKILSAIYNEVKNNRGAYEAWYVGLVGFCASYSGKYFGGYARNKRSDESGSWSKGAITNLMKQRSSILDVKFIQCSFLDYNPSEYKNCVFYLDPPYRKTLSYSTGEFPYEEFDRWAIDLAKNNTVLISEYTMPEDKFECIWSKDLKVGVSNQGDIKNKKRVEKLFMVKGVNL